MKVQPYLTFRGNCQEALSFYQDCLGGDIVNKQTYEKAPMDIPDNYRNKLQHAELKSNGFQIMAYDAAPDTPINEGNQVQMSINTQNRQEGQELFEKLSQGGQVLQNYDEVHWDAMFGRCKDKYGVQWMVNAPLN